MMMALVTTNSTRSSTKHKSTNGVIPNMVNGVESSRDCEQQSKFIQNRITNVEKHFGVLCTVLAGYTRKTARLRDKGDELSKALMDYAESETLNHTCKTAVVKYAENLSSLQDFRNVEVNRLEARVLTPLTDYGTTCKKTREDLKTAFAAQTKERKSQKSLATIRDKHPSDRSTITKAERDLEMASMNTVKTTKALEGQMDSFEKRKLADLKQILQEFVNVEMAFHAKALEQLTQCHKSLSIINEDEDIEEFRNSLRPLSSSTRSRGGGGGGMGARTSSRTSLNSAGGSDRSQPVTPKKRNKPPVKPAKTPNHVVENDIKAVGNHVSSTRANGRPQNHNPRPVAPPRGRHDDDDDDDDEDDDDEYSDLSDVDDDEEESLDAPTRNDSKYYKYNHR